MSADTSAAFFEAKYRRSGDPWRFATNAYELDRYRVLLDAIGPGPFRAVYEPGCSLGVFSELLAPRCEQLTATDVSSTAIRSARRRCARFPQARFEVVEPSDEAPAGPLDLVVFSEIGYYFDRGTLAERAAGLAERLCAEGRLVGTHWRGHSPDHRLSGTTVHETLDAVPELVRTRHDTYDGYLLGIWQRREGRR